MEYIAIPKSDFIKYFRVVEVKEDTVRGVKNEITLSKNKRKTKRKRRREPSSSSGSSKFSEESE